MGNRYASLEERFWQKVEKSDGCWEWRGAFRGPGEYGRIRHEGRQLQAHRVSYEINVGPIPEGLTLDHLCGNRPCVNPAHLEPVTAGENARRYMLGRTHCKWGHLFDGGSYINSQGRRVCLACCRARTNAYAARKRAELRGQGGEHARAM